MNVTNFRGLLKMQDRRMALKQAIRAILHEEKLRYENLEKMPNHDRGNQNKKEGS